MFAVVFLQKSGRSAPAQPRPEDDELIKHVPTFSLDEL